MLPEHVRAAILEHALEARPEEACGLVAGRAGVATRVFRCPNVADDRARRYLMEGNAVRRALKEMDDAGEEDAEGTRGEPLAIYHSHVFSAAYPSSTDRAEARWPSSYYVLVSLRSPDPELKAFRIASDHPGSEKTVREVELGDASPR